MLQRVWLGRYKPSAIVFRDILPEVQLRIPGLYGQTDYQEPVIQTGQGTTLIVKTSPEPKT